MGTRYVPEIFVPSEKRILSPAFHGGYFVPQSGFLPAVAPTRKMPVRNLRHVPVWHKIRLMRFFCDVQAAFGAFHRIEKQPAQYSVSCSSYIFQ